VASSAGARLVLIAQLATGRKCPAVSGQLGWAESPAWCRTGHSGGMRRVQAKARDASRLVRRARQPGIP
jgi:hypothetical protein